MVSVGLRQGCRLVLSVPATNGARCACKCQKKPFVHAGGRIMGLSLEPSAVCFVMKIYFCTVFFVLSFVLPAYVMHTERGRGIWDGHFSVSCWFLAWAKGESCLFLVPLLPGEMRIFPGACPKTGSFGSWINWVHLIKQLLGFFLCFGIADWINWDLHKR